MHVVHAHFREISRCLQETNTFISLLTTFGVLCEFFIFIFPVKLLEILFIAKQLELVVTFRLAHSALNQHREAVKSFESALELDPTNESYKKNLEVSERKLSEQVF